MESIQKEVDLINIRVDYRTELLGIIEIISNYREKVPHLLEKYANKEYVLEIENRFMRFRNHKVIKMFDDLVDKYGFDYDAPVALFLQFDDNFWCDKLDSYVFENRLNKDKSVYELMKLLPNFAKEIDFESFYLENAKRYEKFIANIEHSLGRYKFIDFLMHYYGIENYKKFVINLIPFQTNGNYGSNNVTSVFANMGCREGENKEEDMYKRDGFELSCLLFHEFSHSIINPLTDEYNLISEDSPIFENIKDKMRDQAYDANYIIINEHIIRALTMRYIYFNDDDKDYYTGRIQREKNRGFIYIENIINSLTEYERNRNIYTTIHDFYPIIIKNIVDEYRHTITK